MLKYSFFLFLICTSFIFSQDITNTLGPSGTYYVKENSGTALIQTNSSSTYIEGNLTIGNNGASIALPSSRGTNGQFLQTNGGGSTSWATVNVPQTVGIKYLICIEGPFPSSGSGLTEMFLGQIVPFAGNSNFIPSNFLECKGQTLQIQQYQALFAIIGTTYGGNGTSTFMLPNLTSKVIVGQ